MTQWMASSIPRAIRVRCFIPLSIFRLFPRYFIIISRKSDANITLPNTMLQAGSSTIFPNNPASPNNNTAP